ncbi:SapB/AmfS family lanthipeptide [Streptomyces alkaliphilus]|uniref:SapB/AmfS family lantipeptide n=1 Tax=Streptomyces alkaliphilus TaxID=1472722 RepID=A0A7W3Y0H4_9ACTN|nr:SapB/AmfS family lanthipeptide [Streptomyces alkaliphilus]MBB0243669.1 SapB/AmfS family lantipeptide [Streptomyces alkaliphilus]MQS08926.1 SapB/AmfS family lantipeptide [Streptomyces alkaliphilus]
MALLDLQMMDATPETTEFGDTSTASLLLCGDSSLSVVTC